MARPKGTFKTPKYRLHKGTGQAVVTLDGRDFYLGAYDKPESREKYDRFIGEWLLRGRQSPLTAPAEITVEQVIAAYVVHAQGYYASTKIPLRLMLAMRYLRRAYASMRAVEFGPMSFEAWRFKLTKEKNQSSGKNIGRRHINGMGYYIIRMFKWATATELVPANVYHALAAVEPLKAGRSEASEPRKVLPVDDTHVEACLAIASPVIGAMIRMQLYTGARPGEISAMRGCDLETSEAVWKYRPVHHKTERHGKDRLILIGPKAQEVLREFLTPDVNAYLFTPRRNHAMRFQLSPAEARPAKHYTHKYDAARYAEAIRNLCDRADRIAHMRRPDVPADVRIVARWHPNQLRHNAATYLREQFGIEVARVVLGHSSVDMTAVYAEQNLKQAERAIAQVG